jgi:hypothetical protein
MQRYCLKMLKRFQMFDGQLGLFLNIQIFTVIVTAPKPLPAVNQSTSVLILMIGEYTNISREPPNNKQQTREAQPQTFQTFQTFQTSNPKLSITFAAE